MLDEFDTAGDRPVYRTRQRRPVRLDRGAILRLSAEGKSPAVIARLLGCNPHSVSAVLSMARKRRSSPTPTPAPEGDGA